MRRSTKGPQVHTTAIRCANSQPCIACYQLAYKARVGYASESRSHLVASELASAVQSRLVLCEPRKEGCTMLMPAHGDGHIILQRFVLRFEKHLISFVVVVQDGAAYSSYLGCGGSTAGAFRCGRVDASYQVDIHITGCHLLHQWQKNCHQQSKSSLDSVGLHSRAAESQRNEVGMWRRWVRCLHCCATGRGQGI
jgi:hypothetical protein